MSSRKLVITLSVVALALFAVTALYEIVFNILLRPIATKAVEAQLTNSNVAPVAANLYGSVSIGLLCLCYAALVAYGILVVVRFRKERGEGK